MKIKVNEEKRIIPILVINNPLETNALKVIFIGKSDVPLKGVKPPKKVDVFLKKLRN